MSGHNFLLDTNTVIHIFNGDSTLAALVEGKKIYVSVITELELLSFGKLTSLEIGKIQRFLSHVHIIPLSELVKEKTIELRRSMKIKLPDSIIAASAMAYEIPLVTADRHFAVVPELDVILFSTT